MGAADWYFKYTGSDLADWFDAQDEKYWKEHDEWLIKSHQLGHASPVVVFATKFNDRMATLPTRAGSLITSGFVDALRIGNDFDPDSGFWGLAKGAGLNLLRVITVLEPAVKGASAVGGPVLRGGGIRATSALADIAHAEGPCAYIAINNILSYLSGKKVQLFASVADLEKVAPDAGVGPRMLLNSPIVQAALKEHGITARVRTGLKSIEAVLEAAASSDGPLVFSVEWTEVATGQKDLHRLVAAKDATGAVRLLDYVKPTTDGGIFKGYLSVSELMKKWTRFKDPVLILDSEIQEFIGGATGRKLALLAFADGTLTLALPLVLGIRWNSGHTPDEKMRDMARSVFDYLKSRLPNDAPPPPVPSVLPRLPDKPIVPATPDTTRKRLANSPLAPEAASAPRIDWLTGVQYRLKYLNYYRGAAHGRNDAATKAGVLDFQKSWFDSPADWDAIPGPRTQAALYAAVGW